MYENIQEGQYLIKLVSSAINNTPIKLPEDNPDWERLYRLASFHNLTNTVCYSLLKFPDFYMIPQNIQAKFSADAKKFSALGALQHFESRQVLLWFERDKIFCVPLSGYKMRPLYPRPDMRYMAALAFLIHASEQAEVHKVMTSLGYNLIRSTETTFSYFKAPDMSIEFCTSFFPQNNEYYHYFLDIVQNSLHPEKGFHYIHTLTKEDFYIYMVTHLAHEYAAGGAGICSILDIWIYLKRYHSILDRELIARELNKLNLGLFSFYIEELAWIWFGGGGNFSNQSLYKDMEQHIFSCGVGEHFDLTESAAAKVTTSATDTGPLSSEEREKIFPSLEIMSDQYPILQKMPFLLPIFWLTRLSGILLSKAVPPKKD